MVEVVVVTEGREGGRDGGRWLFLGPAWDQNLSWFLLHDCELYLFCSDSFLYAEQR